MQELKVRIYTNANFEQIATAIGTAVKAVADVEAQFEAAALWFRLDKRRPRRTAPSKQREKLNQIAKSARRLLNSLDINGPDEVADGPRDPEIFKALVLIGEPDEESVAKATRRIGRLVEIVEGIAAAAEFERRAQKAAAEVAEIGKLTVQEGNPGDDAVNDWIAAMMGIYRTITGKEPATSVGGPKRPNEGIAAGPLIRFLQAAGKPLRIEFSEDAWRSREGRLRVKLRTIWPFRFRSAGSAYLDRYGPTRFDIRQEQPVCGDRSADRACAPPGAPGCG